MEYSHLCPDRQPSLGAEVLATLVDTVDDTSPVYVLSVHWLSLRFKGSGMPDRVAEALGTSATPSAVIRSARRTINRRPMRSGVTGSCPAARARYAALRLIPNAAGTTGSNGTAAGSARSSSGDIPGRRYVPSDIESPELSRRLTATRGVAKLLWFVSCRVVAVVSGGMPPRGVAPSSSCVSRRVIVTHPR